MIYICKGCNELCMLPCRACEALCNLIGSSCRCVSDAFRRIFEGPLALYVLGTWMCMLLTAAAGGCGIADSECTEAMQACIVFAALAVTHAVFAYYLQRQITSGLARKGVRPNSHKELATEAMHILLYDFGVCFYVVIYIGSLAFACYSFVMLSCGAGAGYGAAVLLIVYGWFASMYLMVWYFCNCCAGAVASKQQQGQQGRPSGAAPQQQQPAVVGVPLPAQGP